MTFFYAFSVAGFLALGFGLLAFLYARTLCLHVLVFWVYFVALPLATAWLYTGRITSRVMIGQDLYADDLAAALTAHAHLYLLYGLGVFGVAWLLRDGKVSAALTRTFASQRPRRIWLVAFVAAVAAEFLLKLHYDVLLSGSGNALRTLDLPYVVSSILMVLGTAIFGLFCYSAILSARARIFLVPCLLYVPYALATEGRRAMLSALITLFLLRGLSVGFKPNWRLAWIAGGSLLLFILVGPIFIEARSIAANLQATGASPIAALFEAVPQAIDDFMNGDAGLGAVADNLAERGNAGTFLLTVTERGVEPQHGALTFNSLLWAVPSVFGEKPALQVEEMIQFLAHMLPIDDANSVSAVFYVDFGAAGMLLAGAYTALLLYGLAWLFSRGRQFGLFEVVALGTFFILSSSIEFDLVGHFVELRNLALFAPFGLLSLLFARRPNTRLRPYALPRASATAR